MPPALTFIMICGAVRGTKDAAPIFVEYVIHHLRSALHRHHAPADRRFCIYLLRQCAASLQVPYLASQRLTKQNLRGAPPLRTLAPKAKKGNGPMTKGKRTRPYGLSIRLTDEERQAVQKRIKASGLTQRDFVLRALLSVPIINTEGLKYLLPEMRNIGTNANQIAHRCNMGNQPTYNEIKALRKEVQSLWQLLRQLIQGHL